MGLLQKAEEKERRLRELQATDAGKEEAAALLWKDALKSAHGEKVLDNPKVRLCVCVVLHVFMRVRVVLLLVCPCFVPPTRSAPPDWLRHRRSFSTERGKGD